MAHSMALLRPIFHAGGLATVCFPTGSFARLRSRVQASCVSSRAALPGPYDLNIPTVELAYEKHPRASARVKPGTPAAAAAAASTEAPVRAPIVFVHGLFGCKSNTRSVSRALARDLDRDVYCVDLRNHGDSPHTAAHTYPALAADLEHFMDRQGLARAVLVGHSMGAKAVMAVALRPRGRELVAGLVAVDNAPWPAPLPASFAAHVAALREIDAARLTSEQAAYALLARAEPDRAVQLFLLSNMKRADHLPLAAKRELVARLRLQRRLSGAPAGAPAGRHPHDHHPHRDGQGVVHGHSGAAPAASTAATSATAALDAELGDAERRVLRFRVPLDTLERALGAMGDFPYDASSARYDGPALFVRGTQSP